MSGFKPELFIGIGETHAFYTLRESYLHQQWVGGRDGYMHSEVRSFHHFNLSTDLDEAIAKAEADADKMGLPLNADRESLACQMRDIKRATAEEMEARRAALAAREAEWAAEREARQQERVEKIKNGIVSFGKYENESIENIPRGYLSWMVKKLNDFEDGSLMRVLAEVVRDKYLHLMLPEPNPTLTIGQEGERLELDVEVIRLSKYERPHPVAHWTTVTVYIVTMVTPEGACIVSKSSSFYATEGERMRIKATVKCHDDYCGQAQTVVQRIKVLEQVEKKAA